MANRDAGSVTVEDKRYSTLPEVRGRMMGNGSISQRDRYHPLLRGGTETVPTEPEFPIEMEDNHECAYIYEDQWPLYGDYDMNDLVMAIKKRKLSINTVSESSSNTKNRADFGFIIDFDKNNTLAADAFNINKLNIFIIVGGNRDKRREVHVIGYRPTQLAETYLFGGNNDDSSLSGQRYYISKENLAWGIMVSTQFKWALEYTNIKSADPSSK